jgi:hypothetical protein
MVLSLSQNRVNAIMQAHFLLFNFRKLILPGHFVTTCIFAINWYVNAMHHVLRQTLRCRNLEQ